MQLLVADRLIEARDHSLNGRVFNVVQDERDTKLAKEQMDLLPLSRRSAMTMLEQVTSRPNGGTALARPSAAVGATPADAAPAPRQRPLQRHSVAAGALRPVPERPPLQRHSAMGSFNQSTAMTAAAAAAAATVAEKPTVAPHSSAGATERISIPPPPVRTGAAVQIATPPSEVPSEEPAGTPTVVAAPWPLEPRSPSSGVSPPHSVRSAFAVLPTSPRTEALAGMHHVSSVPQAFVDPQDARLRFYGRGDEDEPVGAHPFGGLRGDSINGRVSSGRSGTMSASGRRSLDSTAQGPREASETLLGRAVRRGAALADRIRQSTRTQDP